MTQTARCIRDARKELGLSQAELARAASVSLATVQNTEAGRANPSLSTLYEMLEPLGLAIAIEAAPADWDALITLGLPLAGDPAPLPSRDAATLRRHLGRAARELAEHGDGDGAERRRECVQAMLVALRDHFPYVLRRWIGASRTVCALLPESPSGRMIKLARIARARMSEYL